TIGDTARTINSMKADLIICRGAAAGVPEMIIKELDCPVINAGDGWHEHPTQALFDVYTIFENMGVLKGVKMCVIGDIMHSRVAGSLLRLANMLEMDLSICAPLTLIPEHVEQFTDKIYTDLDEVLPEMDVLYSLRIQEERGASGAIPSLREYSRCYGINKQRLAKTKAHTFVMHPGPVIREIDMSSEVLDSSKSRINEQITNGFAVRMALMWLLINTKQWEQS
ncbi:aspartate carbamoyltransferase, partial [Patescibacteria group bacterium]|nr:aspartate carbamoyltransferase [Patescibacteria group bacterium]